MKNMDNLNWEDNSKAMYEAIIDAMPPLFKAAVKKKVSVWIDKYNIETITEDDVIETVEKFAPENFKEKLLSLVKQLKTK